ncbi:hypothetical protein SKAU_G00318500 [Synaphobranchus kaupii]|uniref:Uncharacterized protein n=1 Tax=Synaphobranchus kaupii TaxID=118154 RepID=A0A9Q1ET43_SYNKA|nr:hypothetical protein SKAU_G00318500 [Synaphobranchus kaupii]
MNVTRRNRQRGGGAKGIPTPPATDPMSQSASPGHKTRTAWPLDRHGAAREHQKTVPPPLPVAFQRLCGTCRTRTRSSWDPPGGELVTDRVAAPTLGFMRNPLSPENARRAPGCGEAAARSLNFDTDARRLSSAAVPHGRTLLFRNDFQQQGESTLPAGTVESEGPRRARTCSSTAASVPGVLFDGERCTGTALYVSETSLPTNGRKTRESAGGWQHGRVHSDPEYFYRQERKPPSDTEHRSVRPVRAWNLAPPPPAPPSCQGSRHPNAHLSGTQNQHKFNHSHISVSHSQPECSHHRNALKSDGPDTFICLKIRMAELILLQLLTWAKASWQQCCAVVKE